MKRRAPVAVAVALALLASAEGVVRAIEPRLREPLRWSSSEMESKVERMDAFVRAGRRASVVFLGSSMVNAGLDPVRAGRILGRPSELPFNAAVNGADVRTLAVWAERVVLPRLRPRAVVLGISGLELNDNGITQQRFWDRFAASPAGAVVAGRTNVVERAATWVEERSALVRYRTTLRRPVTAVREGKQLGGVTATRLGVLTSMPEFHARSYGIGAEFRRRTEDESYHDYAIGGLQLRALDRLATMLRARGVDLLLVSMPITSDAVAMYPRGSSDHERFRREFAAFAERRDLPLEDPGAAFADHTALFVDPLHLNAKGAAALTDRVSGAVRELLG